MKKELTREEEAWYDLFKDHIHYEINPYSLGGGNFCIEVFTKEGCVIEYVGAESAPLWDWLEDDQNKALAALRDLKK